MIVSPGDGLEDIGAVSRAGDREQDVTGRREVLQLFKEDAVISFVVCPGHDAGGVVGEAQDLSRFWFSKSRSVHLARSSQR